MNEKMKGFLKGFGIILLQGMGILVLIFIGLWLFGAVVIVGG